MSGIDHLLQRLRKPQHMGAVPAPGGGGAAPAGGGATAAALPPGAAPPAPGGAFLVTKLSWRGRYHRVLLVTPTHLLTFYPDSLALTNSWALAGDHDLAGVEVGGDAPGGEGGLLTFHFRRDKKGLSSKDAKFACRDRAALLTALYQAVAAAAARGASGLGPTLLGSPDVFQAFKLRKGEWRPVVLRVTAWALERVDPASGAVRWRLEFRHAASPAARLLAPAEGQPAGHPAAALFGKAGRSPRVYACRDRDQLLRAVQTAALRKLGITLAVDSNAQMAGPQLLAMVAAAERERAASPTEAPLAEWEVMRVFEVDTAGADAAGGVGGGGAGMRGVAPRRLVLTQSGLLERRPADYEVADWRQLAAVAAVVRFTEDPQWLAIEWADGVPATTYVTPAREALLAAVVDAAQAAAGRPVPVLAQATAPGEAIVCQRGQAVAAPAVVPGAEMDKLCLQHLAAAARDFLAAGGGTATLATLALSGLVAGADGEAAAEGGGGWAAAEQQGGERQGEGGSEDGSEHGSPRARSAVRRAFARGAAAGGQPREAVPRGPGPGSADAFAAFQRRLREFNASVAYSGVPGSCRADEAVVLALLSHLPRQVAPAAPAAQVQQAAMGADEVQLVIAALQALQRLAGSVLIAGQIVGSGGGAGRIFAALLSGHDHVAAEAARLLLRLFAPAAARTGAGPWVGAARAGAADATDPHSLNTPEEDSAANSAKAICFISRSRCQALVSVLRGRPGAGTASPLLAMAAVEAAAAVACEPGSQTTDQPTLDAVLQEAALLGRPLFALFSHPANRVADAAAHLMRAVAEVGSAAAAPMREAALSEGAVLQHLLQALGPLRSTRTKLSRELVALWADDYAPAMALLRRVFPPGLIRYLQQRAPQPPRRPTQQPAPPPHQQQQAPALGPGASQVPLALAPQLAQGNSGHSDGGHIGAPTSAGLTATVVPAATSPLGTGAASEPLAGQQQPQQQVITPRQPASSSASQLGEQPQQPPQQQQQEGELSPYSKLLSAPRPQRADALRLNWAAFWQAVGRDHCHAGLVWDERTRGELREALQAEESVLRLGRMRGADSGMHPSWNHAEFSVEYPSLGKHLCVGGVYVRLLLEGTDTGAVDKMAAPKEFFAAAFYRFLCLGDATLTAAGGALALTGTGGSDTGLGTDPERDRELCLRALAATYDVHAGVVGPVDGIPHVVALLDATPSRPLRQRLLQLLRALVAPAALAAPAPGASASADEKEWRDAAAAAVRANCAALVASGGVALMVDLVAAAHEASERPVAAALQSNLITSSSAAEEAKEWWYYPDQIQQQLEAVLPETQQEGGRVGPVTKAQLRQLHRAGALGPATPVWAPGMPEPAPLASVRELRWWLARKPGPLTPQQAAGVALEVLAALARQQPAADSRGEPVLPLPLAHRQLAAPRCLHLLAQVLLTGEPALVDTASALLLDVLRHNPEALGGLYRTGYFFFALAYCGSNLLQIARLFAAAHLSQHFRGAGEAPTAGLPLAQRSYLGGLLPDSLLHMVESYGPEAFAAALAGDCDTPELIWTHRMRLQRLVPQMLSHIGDLPRRLEQRCHSPYDYTPCPPVGYPEIESEVFCHRYYLRHLCDEGRFSDWPIVDHVPFLQALLEEWRAELARKPLGMSEADACKVLGLAPREDGTVAEEDMKAAYRRLARLYHPDKNPAGRDKFVAVQLAYERLQAGAAGGGQGPQPWRVLLLLRAQCILFRRYPEVLEPYKYAGYPMLLQAVALPEEGAGGEGAPAPAHFLSPEVAPRLQAAVELCWLTCAASKMNGEELTRSGGVRLLGELLMRCVAVLPHDAAPSAPAAKIATQALRAFAGMACFENAREELAQSQQLVADIVHCCGLERAPAAVDAALQCVIQMCQSAALQALLLRVGVLGHVVPLLLAYDTTLQEQQPPQQAASGGAPDGASASAALPPAFDPARQGGPPGPAFLGLAIERSSMQAARNFHAMLAVRALAALGGFPGAQPPTLLCPEAQQALSALLTETLAPRLSAEDPRPLLTDLNSAVQTPQAMWNASMREELLSAMEQHRAQPNPGAASAFRFTALQGELVVGGVFVRLFVQQPAYPVSDPAAFCKGLVTYLYQQQQQPSGQMAEAPAEEQQLRQRHLLQALGALGALLEAAPRLLGVLSTRPAIEPVLGCLQAAIDAGHAGPLWSPFQPQSTCANLAPTDVEACELALAVLLRLTGHAGCLEAMSHERCMLSALWLAHRPPSPTAIMLSLRLLHALAGTAACAWAAAAQGGTFYLLSVMMPVQPADDAHRELADTARAAAASLLSRLMANSLHGPRVGLLLGKLLPPGLVAAVADGPGEAAVAALAQDSETPERVWTRGMYRAAAEEAEHMAAAARGAQAAGPGSRDWAPPEGWAVAHPLLAGELQLGGVYVRLFLKHPRHPLRDPKAFLEAVLKRYAAELQALTPSTALGSPAKQPAGAQAAQAAAGGGDPELAVLLSAAAVAVLQQGGGLGEHAVALGYADKLARALGARVPPLPPGGLTSAMLDAAPLHPDEASGSILRLLHQLASAPAAGEALARTSPPLVPTLMAAMRWGTAASVLGLETLKRCLSPVNPSRDLLVGSCLAASLAHLLLQRLDWRRAGSGAVATGEEEERDEAVQRVLFVDLLNLLALEGAHAGRARELLDASEVWGAYRGQKHDLFLPAGGSHVSGVAGLLTGSQATRFALPAPASLASAPTAAPTAATASAAGPPASTYRSTAQAATCGAASVATAAAPQHAPPPGPLPDAPPVLPLAAAALAAPAVQAAPAVVATSATAAVLAAPAAWAAPPVQPSGLQPHQEQQRQQPPAAAVDTPPAAPQAAPDPLCPAAPRPVQAPEPAAAEGGVPSLAASGMAPPTAPAAPSAAPLSASTEVKPALGAPAASSDPLSFVAAGEPPAALASPHAVKSTPAAPEPAAGLPSPPAAAKPAEAAPGARAADPLAAAKLAAESSSVADPLSPQRPVTAAAGPLSAQRLAPANLSKAPAGLGAPLGSPQPAAAAPLVAFPLHQPLSRSPRNSTDEGTTRGANDWGPLGPLG